MRTKTAGLGGRHTGRLFVSAFIAVLTLSSCALDPMTASAPEPSNRPIGLAKGLVFQVIAREHSTLTVFDAAKGGPVQTAELPTGVPEDLRREQFAVDWSAVIWAPCDLRLATLGIQGYRQSASWAVPPSLGGERSCFNRPAYASDGRIYAVVTPNGPPPGPMEGAPQMAPQDTIVSVDPSDPTAPVRIDGQATAFDSAGRPAKTVPISQPGLYSRSWATYSSAELVSVTLSAASDAAALAAGGGYRYECSLRLNAGTLLCGFAGGKPEFGLVARINIDQRTNRWSMKTFTVGRAAVREYTLSPDRTKIMVHLRSGWWVAPLTEGAGLTQVFPRLWRIDELPNPPRLVGWS